MMYLIILVPVRVVPKHPDKSVAKDSIRTRISCFTFLVMRKLNKCCFRISKGTNLKTHKLGKKRNPKILKHLITFVQNL